MWLKKILKIGLKEAGSIIDAQKLNENEAMKIIRCGQECKAKKVKLGNFEVEYKDA